MASFGGLARAVYEDVVAWSRAEQASCLGRPIDQPWVRSALARCEVLLTAMEVLTTRAAVNAGAGALTPADASTVKVLSTESVGTIYRLLMEVVGTDSLRRDLGRWGALEFAYRRAVINTFGGGTNEIQREIIAQSGLGVPRLSRR
jgi:hypothetical protein